MIDLPIVDSLSKKPPFLPLTIPKQISEQLITLHGFPPVWFIGQLVRFIMSPTPSMHNFLDKAAKRFNFRSPIVGLHVRRTDKLGTEASFHPLSEYMKYAENFFLNLEQKYQRLGLVCIQLPIYEITMLSVIQ